jgi:type I restriction enzyme S subunit
MVDVDYKWFLNANPDGYEYGKRIIAPIFTELENLTIRNTDLQRTRDLLIPKLISGEVNVTTHTLSMEVPEA